MINTVKRSISKKLTLVIMATTFIALLIYAGAMLAYELRSYHNTVIEDLATQANIIAEISESALESNDSVIATQNLSLLRTRPLILGTALYTRAGKRFAEYSNIYESRSEWPSNPEFVDHYKITGDHIFLWQRIVRNGELLGSVYIYARNEGHQRLINYLLILAGVMGASLGLALIIAIWLRGAVTRPIFAVTSVARHVMKSRDFSLRAQKSTDDETGVLVDAFNDMLSEVERRATALEESNHSLAHEMAERQIAESALRLVDQRKDEFLATLAHELRNPLAPISNALSMLRMSRDNPETTELAQIIMERQLKQMVRLVDDLLDVSRITTGKLTISKKITDIQSVMRDAVESSNVLIKNFGHELTVDMPQEPVYINADRLRLAQVFSNLLNNAAKYTNAGGNINFEAYVLDEQIIVNISDNGIGISPEMLHEIFNMFTQVDRSLERTHAGLGVGLALSRHLIDLHGYDLQATSEGIGKGSTFSIYLNIVQKPDSLIENRAASFRHKNIKRRVLLVDDNVDFVTTMADLLKTIGHEVKIAHDGVSAQQIAREFNPEIAFLDIGMPGMNGYDLARVLRTFPEVDNCTLIAITGWGQEKDRQLSREAGFNHHLVKPVELSQILQLIN